MTVSYDPDWDTDESDDQDDDPCPCGCKAVFKCVGCGYEYHAPVPTMSVGHSCGIPKRARRLKRTR